MSDIQDAIIDFIKDLKMLEDLSPNESLLESKLIKSFDFVQLLLFIEEKMNFRFEVSEINPDCFETVARIVQTINLRKNGMS